MKYSWWNILSQPCFDSWLIHICHRLKNLFLMNYFSCFSYRWYNKDITRTEAEELLIAVVNTQKLQNKIILLVFFFFKFYTNQLDQMKVNDVIVWNSFFAVCSCYWVILSPARSFFFFFLFWAFCKPAVVAAAECACRVQTEIQNL